MMWHLSHRADPLVLPLADRHYNRQKPGTPQFVPPGACLVLRTECGRALWVTSWPIAAYVKHRWPGAWVNSLFRNEGAGRASDLIRQAVAATRWYWPTVPARGMVTFINPKHVRPTMRRGVPTWGYTYKLAGFVEDGETVGGLLVFRLLPGAMPEPEPANGTQLCLEVA
jgi:hypothetical protein